MAATSTRLTTRTPERARRSPSRPRSRQPERRWFRTRPAFAIFLVMAVNLNLAYFVYGAGFAAIRASRLATTVGPFFEGHSNRWMTAQPNGRPTVNPVKDDESCRPAS